MFVASTQYVQHYCWVLMMVAVQYKSSKFKYDIHSIGTFSQTIHHPHSRVLRVGRFWEKK